MTDTLARLVAHQSEDDAPLLYILRALEATGYDFVVPTPATHSLVAGRHSRARPGSLRDVFGWCQAFRRSDVDPALLAALEATNLVVCEGDDLLRSKVRVGVVEGRLYLHSAPSVDRNAVFLGPDSYRFVRFLRATLAEEIGASRVLDIGVGAGVGALTLASLFPQAEVWASDVNPAALRFLHVNAQHMGLAVKTVLAPGLSGVVGRFDLIIANPPYIAGSGGRVYRDGGEDLGTELAVQWMRSAVDRLNPGGRIVLYTGSPVVDGVDLVRRELAALADEADFEFAYDELDPDVFGGTLRQSAYRDVDRIAAVGAVLRAPGERQHIVFGHYGDVA